ncbi:Uncharacterized protein APZ42_011447 [Daphnia magna]|uniref:Uncharacterized protein n=1 Tax=Daphnia magna TaxID=35525 RepID=A0A162SNL1_9CRUS|nr:Uncharacterized protein APZ42_011447 [Daphnia magna]
MTGVRVLKIQTVANKQKQYAPTINGLFDIETGSFQSTGQINSLVDSCWLCYRPAVFLFFVQQVLDRTKGVVSPIVYRHNK